MPSPSPASGNTAQGATTAGPADQGVNAATPGGQGDTRAKPTPPRPMTVADKLTPAATDPDQEVNGRQILSTAFVRMGAGEQLTVELRSGSVLVLRDVSMGRTDYCGVRVGGGSPPAKYCGGYADIVAARPSAASPVADPVEMAPDPPARN